MGVAIFCEKGFKSFHLPWIILPFRIGLPHDKEKSGRLVVLVHDPHHVCRYVTGHRLAFRESNGFDLVEGQVEIHVLVFVHEVRVLAPPCGSVVKQLLQAGDRLQDPGSRVHDDPDLQ